MADIKKLLIERLTKDNVFFNEPMNNHTSFKIGGKADIFVTPEKEEDILFLLKLFENENINYYFMGNGTNLIVKDKGYRGAVIQLFKKYNKIELKNNYIINAQSGALLSSVSKFALKNCLKGMEFASGIPGTIGGAICMNAGAYDGEMKDIVKSIKVIKDGKIFSLNSKEADFGYRKSRISNENMIVLSSELILKKDDYDNIKNKMLDFSKRRTEKQPLEFPSAGSTFKRPEGYFAGKLIMDSGLRGYKIGGAMVSEKHCGFVINTGNATCSDVINIIEHIKKTVFEKFGVMLNAEVKIIGED